ncbi:aldehyde dehydrogenase family protein [Salmonella enterica subsp. enterica]|nr:aldehyde dehydrogenase family protein [Salmonella enterica subsp. enterica]
MHNGTQTRFSQTPFSALALAELARRAGISRRLFNVVTGSAGDIGGELTSNPLVRINCRLPAHRRRRLTASVNGTMPKTLKVSLELGGNAPFIVF